MLFKIIYRTLQIVSANYVISVGHHGVFCLYVIIRRYNLCCSDTKFIIHVKWCTVHILYIRKIVLSQAHCIVQIDYI